MSDRGEGYIGQLMLFAGTYIPKYWMACEGQLLDVEKNYILFTVIGNTYGGDPKRGKFALPDMRGVVPAHAPLGRIGQRIASADQSVPSVQLVLDNLPQHKHEATFAGKSNPYTAKSIISVKNTTGSTEPVEGGYLGKGGTGTGAASIYVAPGSTAPTIKLSGGSVEAEIELFGNVNVGYSGKSTPFKIPNIFMIWCICMIGIYPPQA